MCELLAMSASRSTRLTGSLRVLASRGGSAGSSHDGWGAAFYQGLDVALFREPAPAAGSALVRHLEAEGPAARLAISHIRHATRGELSLANTQPFVRELGGRRHVFAHNGDLPGIFASKLFTAGRYRPVGQTDSEYAFCALLSRLSTLWTSTDEPPLQARVSLLEQFAADLRALGPANFVYSDGDTLFAHGHRRIQAASKHIEPPGLWWLQRECAIATGGADHPDGGSPRLQGQAVLLFASVPLSDEAWRPVSEGQLLLARSGRPVTL